MKTFYDKNRIEELTKDVESHLKFMGHKDSKQRLLVSKELFLGTLPDLRTYLDEKGNTVLHMGFLNKYINVAFYNSYKRVDDLISLEDYFQIVNLMIVDHVNSIEGDYVHVSFENKEKSDVNYMVFKIEHECVNEVFNQADLRYDRNSSEGNKYLPKFGNPVSMDNLEIEIGEEKTQIEEIDEESNEDKYAYIDNTFKGVKLTERQKEVLHTLGYCQNNVREASRTLGIAHSTVLEHIQNIKERVEKEEKTHKEKPKKKRVLEELELLLESEKFDERLLLDFIIKNIEDKDISYIVHEVELKERQKLFNFIKNEDNFKNNLMDTTIDFKPFLGNFLKIYYKNY